MNCIQKQQLVSFPKVRIWKPWFRHFNNHKEFRNEGTVHLFSLMALFSYANFRSNERMISGERYMEAPGQWICKLGSLPRILRVHSKRQALEQLDYYEKYGFLTYEWLDEENEIIRFSITNWKEHCTSLQYNYYSYKGSGFFFFPLPVGRMLLRIAHKTEGIVFSELDAIMLRNSFLMQRDYKIHADVVRLIYQPEWDDLWDLSPEKLSQEYYADRIMKLSESITEAYVASGAGIPTDTLLTKILLGTVGCVPAYDRYFKKALADTGAAPQVFSAKSIRTLGNLYLDHEDEFEKLRKHCGSRIEYPAAKILDMCFFEYGFQRDASSQEDSD